MQESTTTTTESESSATAVDFSDRLPLQLIKSEIIPPAPTRSQSTIDWLPDFAGYSWIAYGASSLLVISHFPSPLSDEQVLIGPIFRQVIELSTDGLGTVSAVSWSPVVPSVGDLAAALDNCIGLFSYDSETSNGSFCWSQTAVLVQSTKVDATAWTDSGDGIVSGGINVILWRKNGKCWEIAWKFKTELPQTLVSATWSIKGPSATAPLYKLHGDGSSTLISEASKYVIICHSDGKCEHVKMVLHHPMPVSMIQWRPSRRRRPSVDARCSWRHVLLTCCLDGTIRLWSEIDDGKVKKFGKDSNDQKATRQSFRVSAVIETNQALNGTLGSNIYVRWATEVDGANQYFSTEGYEHDKAGRCEWLVGFGPQMLVTFWAVHCLDDVAPMRFPRVTLWKRQELMGSEVGSSDLLVNNVVISRNRVFGPPNICSLVRLLPCNSLGWSQLYSPLSEYKDELVNNRDNLLSCYANGILDIDSHIGNFLQVAVHPCRCEVGLAVSIDSSGLILFWTLPTFSTSITGLTTLNPSWKLSGKVVLEDTYKKYTSLWWAPSLLDENCILFMGHVGGIDCFVVKVSENGEEKVSCQNLCTIPFSGRGQGEGPTKICSVPLSSTCKKTFICNKFMLFAVWKKEFMALSWEITMHSFDLSVNCCECSFDCKDTVEKEWTFESSFSGKRYCVVAHLCSSVFPDPHNLDQVTSFDVVCPSNCTLFEEQKWDSAYHMVTGCANGSLKLWRSLRAKPSDTNVQWELVGMLVAHQDPIITISISNCGRKIATICPAKNLETSTTICIWEAVHLVGAGCFTLQDTLSLNGDVVALNWLTLGNGQLLLGVCFRNELRVYAQKRCSSQTPVEQGNYLKRNIWVCIACANSCPAIQDFIWGPRATPVVVHDDYFCLFSQWLFLGNSVDCDGESDKHMLAAIFSDSDICDFKGSSVEDIREKCQFGPTMKMNMRNNISSSIFAAIAQQKYNSSVNYGFGSVVEVAEKLHGALPVYHPEALLMNISSGFWKRAYVALRHLVGHLTSNASANGNCSAKSCHVIPAVPLSNYLEGLISTSSNDKSFQWNEKSSLQLQKGSTQSVYGWGTGASNNGFMPSSKIYDLQDIVEPLEKFYHFAAITIAEKMQVLAIIDLLHEISNPQSGSVYESLDEPGRRFWVAVRFERLHFAQKFGRLPSVGELAVNSGMVAWAFHSDCQDNLFNSLLPNEPSWQEIRSTGFGFWYTNATQLRVKMEKLARQQYMKTKDPKACALLYIVLNRLQVLAGLFKISKDEKDKPLVGFLSRNFQDDKNKAAALKNAYVLMGRHQLELAIAFFLLGGDTSSAVTVCAKNLGDEQLALVICRLLEGNGGPLERHLISKLLLPSATEKGDYWLASYLEWILGNYVQSFQSMIFVRMDALISKSALLSNHASFLDPTIGQYCLMLATKNSMKNTVGERNAALLGRWAILMSATALNRCGLPLEALECLSSSLSTFGDSEQGNVSDIASHELLNKMLKPSPHESSNWISGDVTSHLELHAKIDLAMQYISTLLKEHPSLLDMNMVTFYENEIHQCKTFLVNFEHKFTSGLAYFEQKFSLMPLPLTNMIVSSLCSNGSVFMGYHVVQAYIRNDLSRAESNTSDSFLLHSILPKLLHKTTEEMSSLFSRYIVACSISCSQSKSCSTEKSMTTGVFYMQCIIWSLRSLRATFKSFSCSREENFLGETFIILDLCELYIYFASAWIRRNLKGLTSIVKPLIITCTNGQTHDIDTSDLKKLLPQVAELLTSNSCVDDVASGEDLISSIPEDERWKIVGACLWGHMCGFLEHHLNLASDKFHSAISEYEGNSIQGQIVLASEVLAKLLKTTCKHMSLYHAKQLASFLKQKVEDGLHTPSLSWLEEYCQPKSRSFHKHHSHSLNSRNGLSEFEILWDICADPKIKHGGFAQEVFNFSEYNMQKPPKGWSDTYIGMMGECETGENGIPEGSPGHSSFPSSGRKDTIGTEVMPFESPKEICKRNGELLEALCINSIDQQQAALASNKKGIVFFHWEDGLISRDQSDYVWAEADWPKNGWAGSESIPVPTCVSPGVGLGSKKGTHLGLGGATIGVGSLARPRRDLTGGGAFGIPGYAGIGASGLGWGVQEDFEEFVDPPATVENISTRAFSSHPSRPFFLVGSCNTHIYLWEFGKKKATATYGVLPAANVPPPYALASISSVHFDHCGHRFATAALDGTVCTWQLEVGGRSNVRPTESSLCFNNNASDVTYVTSSGSIIAAAGYNSSNVNVVIWDTLAPPTTSQASIMCHEGGARSLSVFDNDIGSGSISPLIVTGGKGGDVGLHDFRYIATGRTKRHRHSNSSEQNTSASSTADSQNRLGDHNRNGMLWYIPKAHSGSVTKISVIPNTSFFLTGSKDGDVKLWDAKRAKLVCQWPKLHERHTFLQPSSRGFGGVVRAAVTDIQVVSHGFLSCGGDGCVKLVQLKDQREYEEVKLSSI